MGKAISITKKSRKPEGQLFSVRNDVFRKIEHHVLSPRIRQRPTLPEDLPAIRWQEARKTFEQCGLSGSIGPDDSKNVSFSEAKVHFAKSLEARKRFRETFRAKQFYSVHGWSRRFHPHVIVNRDVSPNTTMRVAFFTDSC